MPNQDSQYLYLTTTGRNSGLLREIEIWFTQANSHFYLIAEHSERANWVQNIRRDARISFRVGEQTFAGRACVVDQHGEPELWLAIKQLSDEKYGWSEGLIVELITEQKGGPDA